jgi:hypothetical protein
MNLDSKLNLSYAATLASEARDNALIESIVNASSDDQSIITHLTRLAKHKHTATNLERYLAEHIAAAAPPLAPDDASAAAAHVQPVDEHAADDSEHEVDIEDDNTGKALRQRVFDGMKMAQWKPSEEEERNRKARARRANSRSNK